MYCPQCAVQNLDGAKFCRACGADIRLVPQALQGSLPTQVEQARAEIERQISKRKKPPQPAQMDKGVRDIFKGVGFLSVLIIALIASRGAFWWTIFLIIPTFMTIGNGIAQIVRARQEQRQLTLPAPGSENSSGSTAPLASVPGLKELSSHDTAEIVNAPPSVTEMTTRHLDAHLESSAKDG